MSDYNITLELVEAAPVNVSVVVENPTPVNVEIAVAGIRGRDGADGEDPTLRQVLSDSVSSTFYVGVAASGAATSASVWTIRRTTLTNAGEISTHLTATSVKWDDRLTATYS